MASVCAANVACNLCGQVQVSVLSDRSRSGKPLRTVACRGCGLVWSDPRPHDARKFYEDDYRLEYKQAFEPRAKHVLRAGEVAMERWSRIRDHLDGSLDILDVGSGGGEFAYLLKSLGHRVHGIEPNRGYGDFSARTYDLTITRGFIQDARLGEATYDLVTIWHVLEHTDDPANVFAILARALRPGGKLVVEVPNVEATCQSPRSSFHEAHLFNFNTLTLEAMAARSGLHRVIVDLTEDGGNIMAVFVRSGRAIEAVARLPVMERNHDRVAGVVARHTALRHYLSPRPYVRFAERVGRMLDEWRDTRTPMSARQRLDALYAPLLEGRGRQRVRFDMPWKSLAAVIAAGYAFAIAIDKVVVERMFSPHVWSNAHSWGVHAVVMIVAVALAMRWLGAPKSSGAACTWLFATLPLFALPALI
jgi:2-polyprenyl-3-methyl-5-hydroxy-6-metoxy-1,4-benzoquinol methylase